MNLYELLAIFFKLLNCALLLAIFCYVFVKKIRPAIADDMAAQQQQTRALHESIAELRHTHREYAAQLAAERQEEESLRQKLVFWSARVECSTFLAEKLRTERVALLQQREQRKQALHVKERLLHEVLPRIHERVAHQAAERFADESLSARYLAEIVAFLHQQSE